MLTWGVKVHIMIQNSEPSLESCLSDFELELLKADRSAHTVKNYLCDLRHFKAWLHEIFPAAKVSEIDAFTLQRYRGFLDQTQKRAGTTINRRLQSLRRFFSWALKRKLIEINPSIEVKLKSLPRALKPRSLHKNVLHKVLTFAGKGRHGIRNYALVQLMLQAGLRVGEVEALQLSDIYLYDRSGQVRIRDGKGRKERFVPLNASVRKALQSYFDFRKSKSENDSLSENSPLFSTSRGKKLSKRALQKIISEIMKKSNCNASAHTLRHTFATAHYNDHKKLVELSTLLGHSSLNTTARYTQASHEDLAFQLEESSLNEFGE
jgi:site-specific recombinase XerD